MSYIIVLIVISFMCKAFSFCSDTEAINRLIYGSLSIDRLMGQQPIFKAFNGGVSESK